MPLNTVGAFRAPLVESFPSPRAEYPSSPKIEHPGEVFTSNSDCVPWKRGNRIQETDPTRRRSLMLSKTLLHPCEACARKGATYVTTVRYQTSVVTDPWSSFTSSACAPSRHWICFSSPRFVSTRAKLPSGF